MPVEVRLYDICNSSYLIFISAVSGTALNDSPAGLAAYILEKFSTATNKSWRDLPDGGLTKKYTLDELLTNVMIYWTNGNIMSSQRFYKEFFMSDMMMKVDRLVKIHEYELCQISLEN